MQLFPVRQRNMLVLLVLAAVAAVGYMSSCVAPTKTPWLARRGLRYVGALNRVHLVPDTLDVDWKNPLFITQPWVFDSLMLLYHEVQTAFNEHNVTFWATAGTLLGAVRHGGFMPWDDDVDLVIPMSDVGRLQDAAHLLAERGIELMQIDPLGINTPFKLVRNGTTFPFIDLFLVASVEHNNKSAYFYCGPLDSSGGCTFYNAVRWPREYFLYDDLFPIQQAAFENGVVPLPNRPLDVVKQMFGKDVLTSARGEMLGHVRFGFDEKLVPAELDKTTPQTEPMVFAGAGEQLGG